MLKRRFQIQRKKEYMKQLINAITKRYANLKFRLVDFNCIGYFGLIGFLLIFFHKTVNNWYFFILIHIGIIFAVLEIIRIYEKLPGKIFLKFVRIFYPVILFLFGWKEIDLLVRIFYGNYWATDYVIQLEKSIFGLCPTLWFQQFLRPWLDEIMNFIYNSYYFFMPAVSLTLFFKKKYAAAYAAFFIGTAVHFSNFVLFYLFPVIGPQEVFAELQPLKFSGYFFGEITRILQANGSVKGGAFPSSHVSAAFAWSFIALRYERNLGYLLLPLAIGICIAPVYLGYHYAVDTIFGFVLCLIVIPIALKILQIRNEDPKKNLSP